jgi:uncharacterized protein YbgA (DUF1722 family)/uncharacterized protein YbbK (DUF523 family)
MNEFTMQVVVVSKCLGFDACRYNGEIIQDDVVQRIRPFVQIITVCPEVEIGLGIPRQPIRMVNLNDQETRLIQPANNTDITNDMNEFKESFLRSLGDVDGFILKSRSPSCAIKDANVYTGTEKAPLIEKRGGFFGQKIAERFPHLAVEDEGRLRNEIIREHFLIKLFTLAQFRTLKDTKSIQSLIQFQSQHKYLFMAFHQRMQKELGRIAANMDKKAIEEVYNEYEQALHDLLSRPVSRGSNINVLFHILGYFSEKLSPQGKSLFFSLTEQYKEEKKPLSAPLGMLRSWVMRFKHEYLINQSFFQPYPEQLIEISDSSKRDQT